MRKFKIYNTISGAFLGIYEGKYKESAYLAMVEDAGYSSIEEACEVAPVKEGEILIEEV